MIKIFKKSILILFVLVCICIGVSTLFGICEDIVNFDRDNDLTDKVIDANYISAYKNAIYIKVPIGKNAFSFGVIFIGNKNFDTYTVKHEYGHYLQLKELGIYRYTKYIAIPSMKGYWGNVSYYDYYSQPWEYGADVYGEVNRVNYKYADDVIYRYNAYMNAIKR